jgi:hypothetical protein
MINKTSLPSSKMHNASEYNQSGFYENTNAEGRVFLFVNKEEYIVSHLGMLVKTAELITEKWATPAPSEVSTGITEDFVLRMLSVIVNKEKPNNI